MSESNKCIVKRCDKFASLYDQSTKGRSKYFCIEHYKGIITSCSKCGKELTILPGNYAKYLKSGKDPVCHPCFMKELGKSDAHKQRLAKLNSSPEHKKQVSELAKKNCEKINNTPEIREKVKNWQKSEEGKAHLKSNADKWRNSEAGKEHAANNCKKWRDSDKGKEFSSNLGKTYGPTIGKEIFIKFNSTTEHQKEARAKATMLLSKKIKEWINSLNINICLDEKDSLSSADYSSFDKYNKIPGVWSIWGKLNPESECICLDVAQTKDIGNEARLAFRKLASQKLGKYKKISEYESIIFKIIVINVDTKEERERVEMLYAIENKALFWNPSPTQIKFVGLTENEINETLTNG